MDKLEVKVDGEEEEAKIKGEKLVKV